MSRPNKKRLPGSPEEWLTHARSDLKLARIARKDEDVLVEQVCFHAQQAVEKALKSVLLFHKLDFPLTHDIEELLEIAEKGGIDLPLDINSAGELTPYAVETRYPGYWDEINEADVDVALDLAEQVLTWAEKHITS